jgi:hypothetical protein
VAVVLVNGGVKVDGRPDDGGAVELPTVEEVNVLLRGVGVEVVIMPEVVGAVPLVPPLDVDEAAVLFE